MVSTQQSHDLDLNEKFLYAFDVLENSHKNVFITGKAGTGKSTLLNYFRNETRKNVARCQRSQHSQDPSLLVHASLSHKYRPPVCSAPGTGGGE